MSFFDKLKLGLGKTKNNINEKFNNVFSNFRKVDEELLEELEETLIMSDIGMDTSLEIIDKLRQKVKKENIKDAEEVKEALKEIIQDIMDQNDKSLSLNTKPSVILVIGVNGVGKTTSIGKIANNLKKDGKKVILAAADTFRAAAVEQLEIWSNRVGCDIVKKEEGADPASVVYDAIKKAKEENAISQVKAFKEVAPITGLVLTKLDGTAKGGVVIGIVNENKIPVKFIGVGETIDDMEVFNSRDFVDAII